MKSIEGRLERLEATVKPCGGTGKLYDFDCNEIADAEVIRWPTATRRGLAQMPDGTRKEIDTTATVNLLDIIMERKRQAESGEVRPRISDEEAASRAAERRGLLFLREPGADEPFINLLTKKAAERGEADGCM